MKCSVSGTAKVKALAAAKVVCAVLSLCALSSGARVSVAQERRPPVRRDAEALRRALAAALGGEFEIVRDELTRRSTYHGGGAFWLAHVRPKRSGHFSLKYTYRYEDPFTTGDTRETRAEHTIPLGVGPRGCWRRQRHYMTAFYQPCLGDTIILPVALDAYRRVYTGHAFEFTVHSISTPGGAAGPERWEEALLREEDAKMRRDAVANPAAEHLKYLGSTAHVRPHRSLGYSVDYHAAFKAVKPGRFNLLLGVDAPGVSRPGQARQTGVPVIVVARGTPVTWLAAQESVSEHLGHFSSHAGNNYFTTPVIMQPGEILTLCYGGHSARGPRAEADREGGDAETHPPPLITRLTFYVNPADSFNEWLAGSIKN